MLSVFLEVVLPVTVVAVLGGLAGRWRGVSVTPLSAIVFYLFAPALVFHSMATTEVSAEVSARIVGVMLATFVAMYAGASVWSLFRRHDRQLRAAFAIGATTPNVGNMGLPVALLAFGDIGLQIAVVNLVAAAVLINSAGIAIAATAGGTTRDAFLAPFRYPILYAAAAGVVVNATGVTLPVAIEAPARSLGDAAVPTMLVVLGLQLQHAAGRDNILDTAAVNAGRLVIAPGAAWLAATALGLDGITRATLVVLAAMPTAVSAIIMATEFNARPPFVTQVVVSSTLASMVTLTLLLALLR